MRHFPTTDDAPIPRRPRGWIVSARYDLVFFIGSIAVSALMYALHRALSSLDIAGEAETGIVTFVLFTTFLDAPHILQTFSRSHRDPAVGERYGKRVRLGLPLFVVAGLALLAIGYREEILYFGGLYGIWHIYRQNLGFLRMYQGRAGETSGWDRHLDHALYGSLVLAGVAADLPLPGARATGEAAFAAFHFLLLAFFARQCWRLFRREPVSAPKLAFLGAIGSIYYLLVVALDVPVLAYVAIETAYHDIQYQGWIIHYQRRRFPESPDLWKRWLWRVHAISIGVGLFGAGLIAAVYTGAGPSWATTAAWYLFIPFYMTILYHYYVDGLIWRLRESPELRDVLTAREAPSLRLAA